MRICSFISTATLVFLFLPSCGSDESPPGGASSGSSSSGGEVGDACKADTDCVNGSYCSSMSDGACAAPPTRTCQIYPASCGEGTFRTLCGCDGKTHAVAPCPGANPIDIDTRAGSCPPDAGMFWCGDAACKVGAQYCSESVSGAACVDAPAGCMGAQASCACLATMGLKGCGCVDEPGGGVRITECSL